jgi:hypothetical protein
MANENPEGGLRNHRTEFARESTFGSAPSNPSFLKYSDSITNFSWSSDSVNEARRSLGSADPVGFLKGPETHEITVEYDLVKWFTDGSGNAEDAAYDGLVRDSDQLLPNSHTIVDREDKGGIDSGQTVSGNTSYSTRIYTVAKGAYIDDVAISGDPSDSQPVTVELTYLAQKTRPYQIDQPDSNTLLTITSSDSNDTSQTVTIEDDGAGTAEDVTLDGTNLVSTSSQFGDIDAIELSSETDGDVTVSINTGSQTSPTQGDDLAVISGKTSYNDEEGDLGVPALGTGSHESLSESVETFIGDVIDRGGSNLPYEIPSATVTVANNIEETERSSGYGMALHPANREITMEATMFGESMTHEMLMQHLQNTAKNITWKMDGGDLQLDNAVLQEPGERAAEEGQAVMTTDNTFMADGITFA